MKKKLLIAGLAVLVLGGAGAGTAWLNHVGYIHLWKSSRHQDDARQEEASGIDVTSDLRKLFAEQDKVANGDPAALDAQETALAAVLGAFEGFKPADWREPKNVNAMMAYVLSGGNSEAVEKFLQSGTASAEQQNLAKGILSFALQRPKTALKQIGDIDPRTLDSAIVGPMSLALASLQASESKERSLALYDEARLHSPGTAVEEAALRRQFAVEVKSATADRATQLMVRYVRVFGQSLYAPGFFQKAATEIAGLDEPRAVKMVQALAESLGDESERRTFDLFLNIAQAAVSAGRVKLAKAAAEFVTPMKSISENDKTRAKLYAALAAAPTEAAAAALGELEALADSQMEPADAAVRSAAVTVARSIVNASQVSTANVPTSAQVSDGGKPRVAKTDSDVGVRAVVSRADAAIKQVDKILATGAP